MAAKKPSRGQSTPWPTDDKYRYKEVKDRTRKYDMVRDKAKEVCKVGTDTSPRMKMFLPLKINVVECVGYAEDMEFGLFD